MNMGRGVFIYLTKFQAGHRAPQGQWMDLNQAFTVRDRSNDGWGVIRSWRDIDTGGSSLGRLIRLFLRSTGYAVPRLHSLTKFNTFTTAVADVSGLGLKR
jgi:hypothetical protein